MPDINQSAANPLRPNPPAKNDPIKKQTPEEARAKLQQAIAGSNDVLVSCTTALSIFPDTVTVDRAKYTVTRRTFFRTAEVMSINIEDILNVSVNVGFIFGSLKVVSRAMANAEKPFTEGIFWRNDAIKLKRIFQGYIIALQRSIDCSQIETPELVKMLEKLGEDDHVNTEIT